MRGEDEATDSIDQLRERIDPALGHALERSFELGFLGSMPIADQVDHALGFVALLEQRFDGPPPNVIDLGTGGGVPGLVLASCWPEVRVVLMDASERRTAFLKETIDTWPAEIRCQVIRGRAEELGQHADLRERFDAVTSRSFGLPALVAECGSAFLSVGGWMVVSEPPEVSSEDRWPEFGLATVGLEAVDVTRLGNRFGYQVLHKREAIDARYPRRIGIPAKRPIF
jgi:16S rRNA (guanine527-N7)-methyltransferase